MVRFTRLAVLCFAVVMFAGLAIVLLDLQGVQRKNRDEQRKKDVVFLLDRIEAFAKENNSIPSFAAQLQQVGTAETGCALATNACQATITNCINLNNLMNDRELSVPSDVKIGTYYKTGYAAQFDSQTDVVTVVACGTEQASPISESRSLHD